MERNRQKTVPLLYFKAMRVMYIMKINFNIEIDHDDFNCKIPPEDKKKEVFVDLMNNSINKWCSFSGLQPFLIAPSIVKHNLIDLNL